MPQLALKIIYYRYLLGRTYFVIPILMKAFFVTGTGAFSEHGPLPGVADLLGAERLPTPGVRGPLSGPRNVRPVVRQATPPLQQ